MFSDIYIGVVTNSKQFYFVNWSMYNNVWCVFLYSLVFKDPNLHIVLFSLFSTASYTLWRGTILTVRPFLVTTSESVQDSDRRSQVMTKIPRECNMRTVIVLDPCKWVGFRKIWPYWGWIYFHTGGGMAS